MSNESIAFIGGGNMATSLIAGLIQDGYDPDTLVVSEPDPEKRLRLSERYGVRIAEDNGSAQGAAEVLLLCVKPQMAEGVCRELAETAGASPPLTISIMAGIREADLQAWFGAQRPLVRTMPNTPAMIQAGAIVLHASPQVSQEQRNQAERILRAAGLTRWVDREALLDAVTALSGSGPAYFFLLMEAMERVGVDLGLDPESARLLTIQTALGAARMAMESQDSPRELRQRVTSPGGTTERAIQVFQEGDWEALVDAAMRAAHLRAQELSRLLGAAS